MTKRLDSSSDKQLDSARRNDGQIDSERRSIALGLLGALGGSALLKGCSSPDGKMGSLEVADIDSVAQAATGTNVRWFNRVAGTPSDPGLADFNAASANDLAILLGYYEPGDGGGGMFYWTTTAPLPNTDDGLVFGTGSTGRWKRLHDDGEWNVKWFGVKGIDDGATDNAIRINQIIRQMAPGGRTLYFPPGVYRIATTILLSALDNVAAVTLRGNNPTAVTVGLNCTTLLWDGTSSDVPMMIMSGHEIVAKNISFRVNPLRTALSGIEIGADTTEARTVHGCIVDGCDFQTDESSFVSNQTGRLVYDISIGAFVTSEQKNIEDIQIRSCIFRSPYRAAIFVAGGQPFCTTIENCAFWNFRGDGGAVPYGAGILSGNFSCNILIKGCEIFGLARVLYLLQPCGVTMLECASEGIKRLIDAPLFEASGARPITVIGGRHHVRNEVASHASDPSGQIAATDYDYILVMNSSMLTLQGMFIQPTETMAGFTIRLAGPTSAVFICCSFPRRSFIRRDSPNAWPGNVFMFACLGATAVDNYTSLPTYSGCSAPNGHVDISGSDTYADVFLNAESQLEPDGGSVSVQLTPEVLSGTPTMSSPYVSFRYPGGGAFRISLMSPPGAGTVRVHYTLGR